MDFEEFARGFRQRTAARLVEFEKTLGKAQEDMERAAREAAQRAQQEARGGTAYGSQHLGGTGYPSQPGQTQTPPRRSATGQVRSVLRRG